MERPLSLSECEIVTEIISILREGPKNAIPLVNAIRADEERVRKILVHYDAIYWKRTLEGDRNFAKYSLVDKLENIDPKRLEDTIHEKEQLDRINLDFHLTLVTVKRILSLLSIYRQLSDKKRDELLDDFSLSRIKLINNIDTMNKFVKIDGYSIHDQHTKNLLRISRDISKLLKNVHNIMPAKHKRTILKKMSLIKKQQTLAVVNFQWNDIMMKYSKIQTI